MNIDITKSPIAAKIMLIGFEDALITEQSSPEKVHKNNVTLLEGLFIIRYFLYNHRGWHQFSFVRVLYIFQPHIQLAVSGFRRL